jgi:tetratricopeptide (TPR) repeat protein
MWIANFFSKLEPKDWATLIISVTALFFSILSFRQKAGEGRLALRRQLTDLLEKLTEMNTEIAKSNHLKEEYPPHFGRLLNDQRRFLVRQAAFVASKISDLVSPYEYLVVAGAFDGVDDTYQAERFYQLATKADDPLDRGISIRAYARYLFNQGRAEEARRYYSEALNCVKGESDRQRHFRGDTYERWATLEREWGNVEDASKLLKEAASEYGALAHPGKRTFEVERIRALVKAPKGNANKDTNHSGDA